MTITKSDDTVTMLDCPPDRSGPQKSQQWELSDVST